MVASKLISADKNIFKVCDIVKNIATVDFILMGLKILKKSLQGGIYEKGVLKNLVNFAQKHLRRGPFFNKIAAWKPTTSSTKNSGTGVFLWVLKNS